jgi:soluble lytic murein transglycosylase-like protein
MRWHAALLIAVLPAPTAAIPRDPGHLVAAMRQNDAALATAVATWDKREPPSHEVTLRALFQQRAIRYVARRPKLASAVERRLPRLANGLHAREDLNRLSAGTPPPRGRLPTGPAPSAAALAGWYREGERRFHVRWELLAAVNFVESAFCKVKNTSGAGAVGPMQFMPGTWRAYGLGGDIEDPHDAILGAANYLAANGGTRRERDALWHYNPSTLYVDAVERYANAMARSRDAFYEYYSWQVFVRTPNGDRRVTGP